MLSFNGSKISVNLRPGITPRQPIIPRRYTLTHSDQTGQLFLSIGQNYAADEVNPSRDEVLAEWLSVGNRRFQLHAYVYVGSHCSKAEADLRNRVFVRQLPLALQAIRYGDRRFFYNRPNLHIAPIWLHFESTYPEFCRVEYWGTFAGYTNVYSRKV
jgi:hypothetical protein